MVLAWLIGVQALSDSFSTLLFLRDGSLPDVDTLARGLKDAAKPLEALVELQKAAHLRSLGEAASRAFPLTVGRFLLSILLVISSGMAMSGRKGARTLALQALLANAALAAATFWLLREARYAWIDTVSRVREVLPELPPPATADEQQAWKLALEVLDRNVLISLMRTRLVLFDIGGLLLAAITLTSPRTKAFFDAVAAQAEQTEEP